MIALYLRALFKRADRVSLTQFKKPALPQRIYSQSFSFSQGHYRRYCELVGWSDASTVHPCYLQVATLPLQLACLLDKKSPFAPAGLIHINNEIWQGGSVDLSQSSEVRVRFADVAPHPQGWLVTLELTVLQHGKAVYQASSGYLTKIRAAHVAPGKAHSANVVAEADQAQIGQIDADAATGRRYAKVSGDINPIHLSSLTARLFGFRRAIAHGMWTLATSLAVAVNEQAVAIPKNSQLSLTCQFKKPLLLPGKAAISAVTRPDGVAITLSSDGTTHLNALCHVEASGA